MLDRDVLSYPLDGDFLLRKKRAIRRELLAGDKKFMGKKIAILGGSTTSDIKDMLELFLLGYGIKPEFYESEYNQFWQDAMFDNPVLREFQPDLIYIHTSSRNITAFPQIADSSSVIDAMVNQEYAKFEAMWNRLFSQYNCPIIQNNFEQPSSRLLGNRDCCDIHGKINFINRLNDKLYAFSHAVSVGRNLYIHDLNYASACYGLDRWHDLSAWCLYKYCCAIEAIPALSLSVAHIIKAIYGKNLKGFVLDLDNTLWGGIVGDDGVESLQIGQETAVGQIHLEFQKYLKEHKQLGILLNIASKNDEANAIAGLNHPECVLKPDDFICIRANWDSKDRNFAKIAQELNLLPESLLFVDDNPAEREMVAASFPDAPIPEIGQAEDYIRIIDRNAYFENIGISADDIKRTKMYQENAQRAQEQTSFLNYRDYLKSLNMEADIRSFEPLYLERISQLTNKSNQFNLTTKRFTLNEVCSISQSRDTITFQGRLKDKFGDNGIVSLAIGRIEKDVCHLELWLMSCRVLKRDMEFAMMDAVVAECRRRDVVRILGYYYPTAKNGMVADFYAIQGFEKISEDQAGNTVWKLDIDQNYQNKNTVITLGELSK